MVYITTIDAVGSNVYRSYGQSIVAPSLKSSAECLSLPEGGSKLLVSDNGRGIEYALQFSVHERRYLFITCLNLSSNLHTVFVGLIPLCLCDNCCIAYLYMGLHPCCLA